MNEYDIGDTVTVRATFTVDSTNTDPTTVTLAVTDPSGNVDTYTYAASQITKDATGKYSKGISVDEPGEWIYTFTGTGTATAVGTKRFAVRRSGA